MMERHRLWLHLLLLSTFDLISFEVILEGPSSLMARQRTNLAELDLLPLRK